MDEDMEDTGESHLRTIIHIDIDCFYAQVEEIRNPSLRTKPLGIQQKNCVVTSNYVARSRGVNKLMPLSDALKVCPDLVLVNGEDLINYRKMSANIFELLHNFTSNIEKLGMDENFLDVSEIINNKLSEIDSGADVLQKPPSGCIYPENESLQSCCCGCEKRLILGTHLAKEIRDKLYEGLGITSCAGIAHNKLLAKLVGSRNKPNKQTVFVPMAASRAMRNLINLRQITGIGEKTEVLLGQLKVLTIADLQEIELLRLQKKFGHEMATKLKEWSYGRDGSAIKPSGKPKSISLEDSCRSISVRTDVEEKFRLLLIRLIEHVIEDGRIPIVIKIILRKFDASKKSSHRETKQVNILPSLFKKLGDGKIILTEGGQEKLLKIVMRLFERSVDLRKPFNITLLGLAFSKFQESRKGSRSLANFLIKKSDVEVQSVTSLSSEGLSPNTNDSIPRYVTSSPMHMDFDAISDTSHASCSSDVSESEIEPSPKKTRIGFLIAKRRCFAAANDSFDASSPSKLRVGELRLNSRELDREHIAMACCSTPQATSPGSPSSSQCASSSAAILFSTNHASSSTSSSSSFSSVGVSPLQADISVILPECPTTVDPNVFKELPMDVQQELLTQWRTPISSSNSGPAKSSGRPNTSASNANSSGAAATAASGAVVNKANTLHRYFIANRQH